MPAPQTEPTSAHHASLPQHPYTNSVAVMSSPRTMRSVPRNPGDLAIAWYQSPSRDPAAVPSIPHVNMVSPLVNRRVPYRPGDRSIGYQYGGTAVPRGHTIVVRRSVTVCLGWCSQLCSEGG